MSGAKKNVHGSGTVEWRGSRWWARVVSSDGSRRRIPLDTAIGREDRAGAAALAARLAAETKETK